MQFEGDEERAPGSSRNLHGCSADITIRNNYAIQMAAKNGHQEVVRHLYENGADITVDDNYSLKMAEKNGQLDVVKRLGENIE